MHNKPFNPTSREDARRGLTAELGVTNEKRMNNYFVYWKRGWWALGLLISINVILGVVYAGLAFLLQPLLGNPFPFAVAIAWLAVGAPIAGLLFEKFASWTKRVNQGA